MSTNAESEVRDIGKSKQEALRALLNSLAPHEKVALPNNSDVDKLAERLDELLASKGGLLGAQTNIPRDDQGRPLNEEGLPIMEIVELVTNDSSANLPPSSRIASPSSVSGQAPLSPLPNWALSPVALAARRRERDRILDLLEQEEQEELARDVSGGTTVTRMETVSPVEPKTPPRTLGQVMRPSSTASRMTHPEQHVGSANTAVAATIPHPQKEMIGGDAARKPKKQKSVSFKDLPPPEHSSRQIHTATSSVDWGDVVPVSLDPRSLRTPGPKVMKELVVERPLLRSNPKIDRTADSDDEDEYVEEAECVSEEGSEPEVPPEALYPAASDDESEDDEENDTMTNNDETDIDEAMLQREIALAYYARRNQIGPDVASGPLFDSTQIHGISGHRGENAAKSSLDDQFNTTRFRGSRLDGDPQTLVNSAIQFGRLVDGQLVAGEVADQEIDASINALTGANDTNEEEDMTEKMIQLLMQGEIFPRDEFSIPPAAPSGLPQTPASPGSSRIGPFQPQTAPKPKPKIKQPISDTLSTRNQRPVHQPAAAVTSTAQPFPPMVIESGFGFDPAFQVAPNPGASATKPVAPMSERVKERSVLMSSSAQGKSRLARALETEAANSPLTASINQETPSALRGDIFERVKPMPGKSQPPETSRRISRFRAERAGIL